MRKPVIAGNWKMYKTIAEAVDFIEKIKPVAEKADHCEVIVAPPFTALAAAAAAAKGSKVSVAAQNCHWDKEGAHTGDISTGDALRRRMHPRDHRALGAPARLRRNRRASEQESEGGARRRADADRLRG